MWIGVMSPRQRTVVATVVLATRVPDFRVGCSIAFGLSISAIVVMVMAIQSLRARDRRQWEERCL